MQWVGENGWSEPIFIWVTLLFSWVRWQGRGMVENMGKYNSQRQEKVGSIADRGYSNGESSVTRLIRAICKSVQEGGCKKCGKIV